MRLSWDLIASAMAVVEHGSFSAAARAHGVTQPTIRRHVEELEAALGVALFTRSPSGLLPTDAARNLEPYGAEISVLVEAMVRSSTKEGDKPSGTVRLTCSETFACEVIPQMLAPLLAANPELEIELDASDRNQDLLRRDADIAVRMVRPTQTGLSAQLIGTVDLGFYASRPYLKSVGVPAGWSDMVARCRLIGEDRRTAILATLESRGLSVATRSFSFRSDRDTAQLAAIRAGVGVGICQVPIGERDPHLRRVLPELAASLELWLVAHEDLRNQRRIRVVLDHLAAALRNYARHSTTTAESS